MIFGKTRLELKVGVFVFFGLAILTTFILFIGNFKTWGSSHKINFIFNFVNGVKIGAPVRFAGVDVGEVKEIKFVFSPEEQKTKVKLVTLIKKEVYIPADSKVWVNTLGLLGEKYLELMPGKDSNHYLLSNSDIKGNDPVAMHEVGETLKSIVDNMNETIVRINKKEGTVGKLLYDDTIHTELVALVGEFNILVKEAEGLVADIRQHPWKLFWKNKEKPVKK